MIDSIAQLAPAQTAAPAASTNSSTGIEQDFSALLIELVGGLTAEADTAAAAQTEGDTARTPAEQLGLAGTEAAEAVLQDAAGKAEDKDSKDTALTMVVPFDPTALILAHQLPHTAKAAEGKECGQIELTGIALNPQGERDAAPVEAKPSNSKELRPELRPELEEAEILEDVKKIEFEVEPRPAEPEQSDPRAELLKQPTVVTDPIASLRQHQLMPRVMPVQKAPTDARTSERKNEPAAPAQDPAAAAQSFEFSEAPLAAAPLEQVRAAQPVEIPVLPKLQVIRTVSMEVGDAESQVIVRIEEQGGKMNLHFGAGSENMRHSLESSMEALVGELKKERIQISNVDVSRKATIEKVRRMKESQ